MVFHILLVIDGMMVLTKPTKSLEIGQQKKSKGTKMQV